MRSHIRLAVHTLFAVLALAGNILPVSAQTPAATPAGSASADTLLLRQITNADRKAAAARAAAAKAQGRPLVPATSTGTAAPSKLKARTQSLVSGGAAPLAPAPVPPTDVFNFPNYANSPFPVRACSVTTTQACSSDADCPAPPPGALPETCTTYVSGGVRKFVDSLPGLGPTNANNLGQYIPVAVSDPNRFPGSDYYEIGLRDYSQQLHSDLPGTPLRGYYDNLNPADSVPHYLGPLIIARRDRPVRVKFIDSLDTSDKATSNLLIPVDTSVMGAGMGPDGSSYTQNRATLHLHGGVTPWISDGTPHQWITPAGDPTTLKKGLSQRNVPDMGDPGDGAATFYWTNQQSARLMFYHDHSYGITRLNVYAGEAAGYLITDPVEEDLISNKKVLPDLGGVYHLGIPLILQDKTFVPDTATLAKQDPTWDTTRWGGPGGLWFPHVYVPNQNPYDPMGVNAFGRWDYGPWFWPPAPATPGEQCPVPPATGPCAPGLPNPSIVPEGFMDTPLVNGTAYPTLTVPRQAVRFRILNAANDRTLNLSLFFADASGTEVSMVSAVPHTATSAIPPCVAGVTKGTPGYVTQVNGVAVTNPATGCWPSTWPADGRDGGVPDPLTAGPSIIQIGTEGGFLPAPVQIDPTPVGYEYNRRNIVVLNVSTHALLLGPAERADVIVDFSGVPDGSKLILYNDNPAPMPAFDTRYDYYTGDPDQTSTGGAPTTLPGYGPNTRTIMQFVVSGATAAAPFDLNALQGAFAASSTSPGVFQASQPPPVVPEAAYGPAYNTTFPDVYARIQNTTGLTFTPVGGGAPVTLQLAPKAIQELFDPAGRMNATLGAELPNTTGINQTTVPLGYVDPPTDFTLDGQPQLWKITHNGVDTHAIHFHLFNVQVINRVGWDGQVRPPDPNELGWKETVRMSPLEDAIVAVLPISPVTPWALPDMSRPLDVTQPTSGSVTGFDPLTGATVTVPNSYYDYGAEYVWHCHLLGHEENDMMRPLVHLVTPEAPSGLVVVPDLVIPTNVTGTFMDNSARATSFLVQRSTDAAFSAFTTISVPATAVGPGSVQFADAIGGSSAYYYRVQAVKTINGPYGPNTVSSAWSNTAVLGASPVAAVSPPALVFASQLLATTSAPQPVTVSATGAGTLAIGAITITGAASGDFAQSGNCGTGIAGGATCTLNVTFTPKALGSRTATLSIATSDPANPVLTVTLSGTGAAPIASVAPTTLSFGNQLLATTSAALTATVSNTGTLPLTVSGSAVSGTNAGDFARVDGCTGTPVAAGGSCTISVTFTPSAGGNRAARLTINTSDPANPALTVLLSGTGVAPIATLTPAVVPFGNQLVATTSLPQTVTLTNTGTAPLSISGVSLSGPNPAEFGQASTCGASLTPGASCSIPVTFAPASAGAKAASLDVTTSDPAQPLVSAALTGTGIAPVAAVAPTSLAFGTQTLATTSAPHGVVLSNTGTASLVIGAITASGDFAQTNGCLIGNPGLAPGASCTIQVTFTPTATGARTGAVTIASSDPLNPSVSVSLTGLGSAVALSPAAIAFPAQQVGGTSPTQVVTLVNTARTALTITGVSLAGANPGAFAFFSNCGATVNAGRSCTIYVRFVPTATGSFSAALTVATSDPASPGTVALSGTGIAPLAAVSPTSLTFAKQAVGTTSAGQQVVLTNAGTAPLGIRGISIGGGNATSFSQTSTCGTTVAAGASCTITVTFTPTRVGTRTANLNIRVNAPAVSQTVPLTGVGQ
jgi:FtsP/CotA-like multicopper oxidase with cupredoxin domain